MRGEGTRYYLGSEVFAVICSSNYLLINSITLTFTVSWIAHEIQSSLLSNQTVYSYHLLAITSLNRNAYTMSYKCTVTYICSLAEAIQGGSTLYRHTHTHTHTPHLLLVPLDI